MLTSLTGNFTSTDFDIATSQTFAPITASQLSFSTPGFAHSHGNGSVDVFVEVHNTASGQWDEVYRQTIPNLGQFNFNGLTINFAARPIDQVRLNSNPFQFETYHNWSSLALTVQGSAAPTVIVHNVPPVVSGVS